MTATACCTSKPIIYQIQVITARSQFTPILPRTSLSPSSSSSSSSSIISISELRTPVKLNKTIQSDVNNNNDHHQISNTSDQHTFFITNNDDDIVNTIDEEQFLAFVGLRHKTKKKSVPISTARPLAKRLAAPICLLPFPKYSERVRQALYILLPFLKFLSIIRDVEPFCSTDKQTKAESLLPRSAAQTRTSTITYTKTNKRKVSKSEFITMAANTFRNNTRRTPMAKYIHSTIQCQVVLDRLDQATIDQIMQNFNADNQNKIMSISKNHRALRNQSSPANNQCSLDQTTTKTTTTRTTITTMTTEKTTVKHKSTTASLNDSKRLKTSIDNNCFALNNSDKPFITYKRIYLKCFVCSKREFIDAQATNSDILHSHWLEHGHNLLLNIYDSELDSVVTRIVEFFHCPRQHTLEGKIQTVFILNSKEIRKPSAKSVDDDSCIVLD